MKFVISKFKWTKIMAFVLPGFFILGCSNNEKIIKERIVRLTEDYFNSTNNRPNIDSLKLSQISEEVYTELSANNSKSKILKTLNSNDSLKLIDLIYDYSFPIAFNSRHAILNDTTQIFFLDSAKEFFDPSVQNFRDAENLLIEDLKKQPHQEHWLILDTLSIRNYYRQYSFYKQTDDDSMVFINAFCHILKNPIDSCGTILWKPADWRNKMLFIDDGGDCYWRTLINLTNKKVEYLMINGVG